MKISINQIDSCRLDVRCEASSEVVAKKFDQIANIYKTADVPGFGEGKAPIDKIKVYYRNHIAETVKKSLTQEALNKFIADKSIKPIGQPVLTKVKLSSDKFVCNFSVNKAPDFQLRNYVGFELKIPTQKSTVDGLTDKLLAELAAYHGESIPFSDGDVIGMGDRVTISYDAFFNGQKQKNFCTSSETIVLGKEGVLKGFDANLIGLKIGESKTFDITLPPFAAPCIIPIPSLKGKTLTIKANIVSASKVLPHPINEDLALKFGKSKPEELRRESYKEAVSRLKESSREELVKAVKQKLNEEHNFEIPEQLVLSQVKSLVSKCGNSWEATNKEDRRKYIQEATDSLRTSIILEKIIEIEPGAQLPETEVVKRVKDMINKYSKLPYEQEVKSLQKSGDIVMLVMHVREGHALDYILNSSKIV